MKFTAAGDALIQRRIFEGYQGFSEIGSYIKRGDGRFFNLETTLNREGECFASQLSGGTYVRAEPEVLGDMLNFGFNMMTFNNNHIMDFSYEGLLKTVENANRYGVPHSGVGRNLAEASAPAYADTPGGRIALISVNSTFNPGMLAGEQSPRVPGRPGINGLRVDTEVHVTKDYFETLSQVAEKTGINAEHAILVKEGYRNSTQEGSLKFGDLNFKCDEECKIVTTLHPADLMRVKKAIFEAKLQADYIMISVHSHEIAGSSKENPSDFLVDFCHFCIDEGANTVVGHGPHLLRPIEVYKNRPIFYSLGDFVLQLYSIPFAPEDFFNKQDLSSQSTVHELLKKRSADFTRGLMADKRMNQAVIPYWETDENGDLTCLELLPIELYMGSKKHLEGLPYIPENKSFLTRLAEISADYGTKIEVCGDIGKVTW